MHQRPQLAILNTRLQQPRRFLQVLAGPRQVGKTTLARQAIAAFPGRSHYASADLPAPPNGVDQLQDAGNTSLAHYRNLLISAGVVLSAIC